MRTLVGVVDVGNGDGRRESIWWSSDAMEFRGRCTVFLPGHNMNWAVLLVVGVTTNWLDCGCWWSCWCNARLKVPQHVGRVFFGQRLIMGLVAQHNMAWGVEAEAAGGSANATCNHAPRR